MSENTLPARAGSRVRTLAHRRSARYPELPHEGRLGRFDRGTGWLNSDPLTTAQLECRVVLVDFWTYTCVNWLRTLPYLRAWDEKYRGDGLTIVGVHTPEFGFERDPDNVSVECRRLGVTYPVLLDSHYGVWEDFANHYWPAVYLADTQGRIRYHHFGEGEYATLEMNIQTLLQDGGAAVDTDLVTVAPQGLEVAADWRTLRSPETYLGFDRSVATGPAGFPLLETAHPYRAGDDLPLNGWDLDGVWTVSSEYVRNGRAGSRLRMRFHARDANLIMRSADGSAVPFRVLLDGELPGEASGVDLAPDGHGEITRPGTYQLIRQSGPIVDRMLEIEFSAPEAEAYCFTFG